MKATPSHKSRHLLLRAESGDVLPDAFLEAFRSHSVSGGFLRGSGVLADVELRAFRTDARGLGAVQHVTGPLHVLSLEGAIGLSDGQVSMGMRAVLGRESDRGIETLAGEIVSARVVALEALVTVLDDVALVVIDDRLKIASPPHLERTIATRTEVTQPPWAETIAVGAEIANTKPFRSGGPGSAMPPRPARPLDTRQDDLIIPEPGDAVDHFAFGLCEVLKSDGDRLHLKVQKDGRVKEIALEMLRVQPLESEGPSRRFRLERKM